MGDRSFERLFKEARVGVLACVGLDGDPIACTVFLVADGSSLVFKSRGASAHMSALRNDPRAALSFYWHASTYETKAGVQLKGIVDRVSDVRDITRAVDLYSDAFEGARAKFAPVEDLVKPDCESTMYRFVPTAYKVVDGTSDRLDLEYRLL